MEECMKIWELMARELNGSATPEELLELNALCAASEDLAHYRAVFLELWAQQPEADTEALSAAWEKIKAIAL